jgi:hypothetical protein
METRRTCGDVGRDRSKEKVTKKTQKIQMKTGHRKNDRNRSVDKDKHIKNSEGLWGT